MKIWITTYWAPEIVEPVVTPFDNQKAAETCARYYKGQGYKVCIDECDIFHECKEGNGLKELFDALEAARIYAGAEMERLCNNYEHIDACVFQTVRDSIALNIQLLQSYATCKAESDGEK